MKLMKMLLLGCIGLIFSAGCSKEDAGGYDATPSTNPTGFDHGSRTAGNTPDLGGPCPPPTDTVPDLGGPCPPLPVPFPEVDVPSKSIGHAVD